MKLTGKLLVLAGLSMSLSAHAQAVDAAAAAELAKKSNCLACHQPEKKVVGPAWTDIGKKYAGDAGAAAQLADKVKKGTKGVWGPVPMPPNPTIKDADIKTLVAYILTFK